MDVNDELEPLTVYSYDVSPAMDSLIRNVLGIIPKSYAEDFPSFSVFESPSPWGAHVEESGELFCDPKLLEMSTDIATGILAHEFAHIFLGHSGKGGL